MDELEEIMLSKITVPVLSFIYGNKNKDDLREEKKKNHKTGSFLRPCTIH